MLVVEDEIHVRSIVSHFLRQAGYTVIEANNAAEAVAIFGTGRTIDLVFSDVETPGPDPMDGIGLAHWISQHRPGIDVILTFGERYDAHAIGAKAFLAKPLGDRILRIRAVLQDPERAEQ